MNIKKALAGSEEIKVFQSGTYGCPMKNWQKGGSHGSKLEFSKSLLLGCTVRQFKVGLTRFGVIKVQIPDSILDVSILNSCSNIET